MVVSDSSAEARRPGRIGRAFWWRLTDNLFRRMLWFLIPILLAGALGVTQARNTTALYRSSATLSVSTNPLLPDQILSGADAQAFESLSGATTRIIGERLGTDSFMASVAQAAGLGDAVDAQLVGLDVIRASVWVTSRGTSLVSVNATWADPQTSYQLVVATIDQYHTFLTEAVASDATEAEDFWNDRLATLEDERDVAEEALDAYVSQLPGQGTDEDYPVTVTFEMSRLSDRLSAIEDEIRDVEEQVNTAVLSRTQQTTAAGRSFTVVDKPVIPTAPESTLIKQAMLVVSFLLMGVVISFAALLVTTVLDQTVAAPIEVAAIPGVLQVATVPIVAMANRTTRRRRRRRTKRAAAGVI